MSNSIIFTYPKEIKNALDDVLPIPIKFNLPDWYKKLEHTREFPTIKGCMPFLDTLTSGYLLKMPQDFFVEHNHSTYTGDKDSSFLFSFNKYTPQIQEKKINLNTGHPEIHSPKQLTGSPLCEKNKNLNFYKILNPFKIKTPPGYSCLFLPPLNNHDDRFEIIPGIVDTDVFNREVNFPIVINGDKYPNLKTTIKRGTPYVQIIPFKRDNWEHKILIEKENNFLSEALQNVKYFVNNYKRTWWNKKKWN